MEMTKEKRDIIITSLYEKYGKGEISANQRELLIQKVNDKFYTEMVSIEMEAAKAKEESKEEETASEETPKEETKDDSKKESKELSPKEKMEKFTEVVNKQCEDGKITEEFRDQLLEKAKEKFLSDKSE